MWRLHGLLVAVLLAAGVLVSNGAEEGRLLFRKMQNAIGGAERIAGVHDFEQFERADTWLPNGQSHGLVEKRVRFIRPSYLRIDQVGQGDTYVLYFDGKGGWEILPNGTVADLAGGELRFAEAYLNGLLLNSWLSNRDPDIVLSSTAPNEITISYKGDTQHKNVIKLDAATLLPADATGISLADPDHPVMSETLTQDWHTVGGLKFPGRIVNFHAGKKLADIKVIYTKLDQRLSISDAQANEP